MAFERNLAGMEKTKYAFAMSCGMSAISTVLHLLSSGDHLVCVDDVYGGTQRFFRKILAEKYDVSVTMKDFSDEKELEKAIIPGKTKMLWLETPTNPTLKIFDIAKVSKIAKKHNLILVVDNTFFTPYLQNPCSLGADIVIHSVTKYIGGHSDVVMGAIMLNDKEIYDKIFFVIKSIGTGCSPFDAYLALRGSKTLAIRMDRAMFNA